MADGSGPKITQGQAKMLRYIEDLIRNRAFVRRLNKMKKDDWLNSRAEIDKFNREIIEILDGYNSLRKRSKKIFSKGTYWKNAEILAYLYGLDNELIQLALALKKGQIERLDLAKATAEPDMCKIQNIFEDAL